MSIINGENANYITDQVSLNNSHKHNNCQPFQGVYNLTYNNEQYKHLYCGGVFMLGELLCLDSLTVLTA